jgi:hypothetical protein
MDIREKCRKRAVLFAKEWGYENVSDHILDIMVSIMCTRDKSSYEGGSFVQSVVANDLYGAATRADGQCIQYLKLLAVCNKQCYAEQLDYRLN